MTVWEDADVVFHTELTIYSQQVTRRGNGPYGCSVRAWVIRSTGQVILHQEKKSSEFEAMVMGSVTFWRYVGYIGVEGDYCLKRSYRTYDWCRTHFAVRT